MSHTASDKNYITDGNDPSLRATVIDNWDGTKSLKVTEPTLSTISSDIATIKANIALMLGNQTDGDQITQIYTNSAVVGVQNPFSVDGDSIYAKDVDVSGSTIGGFSGAITDLFDSITSTIVDSSATNPKSITIKLNRPVDSSTIEIATTSGNFSNVKVLLKDGAGNTVATIDDSANNTKYQAAEYATTPIGWCTITIQFHTADTVTIGFICIQKSIHTHSILQALKPDNTKTFINSTTSGNLKVSVEEYESSTTPFRTDLEGGGIVTVGTTAVEMTFTGATTSIMVSSLSSNTGTVYIGKSNVTNAGANSMCFLLPGESVELSYNDATNAVYAVATVAGQSVIKGALL